MAALPPDLRASDPVLQRLLDWLRRTLRDGGFFEGTWPGAVSVTRVTIPHGLGVVPKRVFATGQAEQYTFRWVTGGTTDKQLQLEVRSWDNTARAAGTALAFSWEAAA